MRRQPQRRHNMKPTKSGRDSGRSYCDNHGDCPNDMYCDEYNNCWDCSGYLTYCDSFNGECASHCQPYDDYWQYDYFGCDQCSHGGGGCNPGWIYDCDGNCAPAHYLGDNYCDDGGIANFNCAQFNFDEGDCETDHQYECYNHSDCGEHEYCADVSDWWNEETRCENCYEYWFWCDAVNGHCPVHCLAFSNQICECPECPQPVCGESELTGDVNMDGTVNVVDAVHLIQMILGTASMPDWWSQQFRNADVNNDGSLDIFDIIQIVDIAMSNQLLSQSQGNQLKAQLNTRFRPNNIKTSSHTAKIRGGQGHNNMAYKKRARRRRHPVRRPRRGRDNK